LHVVIQFFIFYECSKIRYSVTDKTIFVVEDDGIIALNNYELLTKSGYAVPQMFASGEELLDHLELGELPDLILMDIGLAGKMDGIETARLVRQRYDIPVVFLSSYADDQRKERAAKVSPFGYIVKPAVKWQLIATVGAALGRSAPSAK
jgi:two-component system, response regulator PdtaR